MMRAVFFRLAVLAVRSGLVDVRWRETLEIEADAMAAQPPGPRIHSGWPVDVA
jgi:hypothetical protein